MVSPSTRYSSMPKPSQVVDKMPPMKLIDSTPSAELTSFQKLSISDTSSRTMSTSSSSSESGRSRRFSLLSRFRSLKSRPKVQQRSKTKVQQKNSPKVQQKNTLDASKQTSGTSSSSSSLSKEESVESYCQEEESVMSCYLEEDSIASSSSSASSEAPDEDEVTVVEKIEAALAHDHGTVVSSRMPMNLSEVSHMEQSNNGLPSRITQPAESSATKAKEFQKQRLFWQNAAMKRSVLYGSKHLKTAETLFDLGNAQMSCEEYVAAGKTFLSALKIVTATHGDRHLSVALALDKLGMAACKTNANLELALAALEDAFLIRRELLGLEHLDTVDSLNNIAGVRLNLKQYDLAAKDYYAVLVHRMELFGQKHISVAATAFQVAWILETFLHQSGEAREFYLFSLHSYQALHLEESPQAQIILDRLSHRQESGSYPNSPEVEDLEDERMSFLPPSLSQQSRGTSRRIPMDAS